MPNNLVYRVLFWISRAEVIYNGLHNIRDSPLVPAPGCKLNPPSNINGKYLTKYTPDPDQRSDLIWLQASHHLGQGASQQLAFLCKSIHLTNMILE